MNLYGLAPNPNPIDTSVERTERTDEYNAQLASTRAAIDADRKRAEEENRARRDAELKAAAAVDAQHKADAARALEPDALIEAVQGYLTNQARRDAFDRAMPAPAITQLRQEIDTLHRLVLLLSRAIR